MATHLGFRLLEWLDAEIQKVEKATKPLSLERQMAFDARLTALLQVRTRVQELMEQVG